MKDMVTKYEFSWYFNNFSAPVLHVGEIFGDKEEEF